MQPTHPNLNDLRYSSFKGVFVAMVTPFSSRKKDSLDREDTKKLLDFLLSKGVDGLFAFGSTGEGPLLDNYENFYRDLSDLLPRGIPVILHTGMNTLSQTIEVSKIVAEDGTADAIAIMPPYFYGLGEKRLQQYYEEIFTELKEIPVFLYDIPQFTGNPLSKTLLKYLARRYDNLAGIKSSTPEFSKLAEFTRIGKEYRLSVFVGNDDYIYSGLCLGATGLVSGPANALPELYVDLFRHIEQTNLKKAMREQSRIDDFIDSVIVDGTHVARIKQATSTRSIGLRNLSLSFPEELKGEAKEKVSTKLKEFIARTEGGDMTKE